ncbi:unnamed protein product [Enterobius vermicularis]|uniref:UPF0496 protein n=1 Tax=Enterobius vermicularis TaxID=51028 RepID=A0A0N4VEX7_ENTVE|nr:unnamed protein product [Enterobius vermicularis]
MNTAAAELEELYDLCAKGDASSTTIELRALHDREKTTGKDTLTLRIHSIVKGSTKDWIKAFDELVEFKNSNCERLTADALNEKHSTLKTETLKKVKYSIKEIAKGSPKKWLQCVEHYVEQDFLSGRNRSHSCIIMALLALPAVVGIAAFGVVGTAVTAVGGALSLGGVCLRAKA